MCLIIQLYGKEKLDTGLYRGFKSLILNLANELDHKKSPSHSVVRSAIDAGQRCTRKVRRVFYVVPCVSNKPFPCCLVPLFESEVCCTTFRMKMSSASLPVNENSFSYERLCTKTRFKRRYKTTRKWSIDCSLPTTSILFSFRGVPLEWIESHPTALLSLLPLLNIPGEKEIRDMFFKVGGHGRVFITIHSLSIFSLFQVLS